MAPAKACFAPDRTQSAQTERPLRLEADGGFFVGGQPITMNQPESASRRPLLLKVSEVCEELGIGRTKLFQLLRSNELRARRIGRSVRVHRDEVERFALSMQEED